MFGFIPNSDTVAKYSTLFQCQLKNELLSEVGLRQKSI